MRYRYENPGHNERFYMMPVQQATEAEEFHVRIKFERETELYLGLSIVERVDECRIGYLDAWATKSQCKELLEKNLKVIVLGSDYQKIPGKIEGPFRLEDFPANCLMVIKEQNSKTIDAQRSMSDELQRLNISLEYLFKHDTERNTKAYLCLLNLDQAIAASHLPFVDKIQLPLLDQQDREEVLSDLESGSTVEVWVLARYHPLPVVKQRLQEFFESLKPFEYNHDDKHFSFRLTAPAQISIVDQLQKIPGVLRVLSQTRCLVEKMEEANEASCSLF